MRLEGEQLDHYQIIGLIGSGGMGDVYLAEDSRIGQQVAIKVIWTEQNFYSDDLDGLDTARLLRREARAISQLDHPHILPLYNYGETQIGCATLVYLVMPYRPEGSLVNWLRQHYPAQRVPLKIVANLIKQAAEALQEAHDHRIVHQDIKPSNFLIRTKTQTLMDQVPELLLSDFGIAHVAASSASSSQNLGGTPIYMAPEQCQGNPVFASDQYALAVMTYELLTGRPPFQGNAVRLMYQHLSVIPAAPSTLQPQIPRELDVVLLKALQKRPEDRFASVTEFAETFERTIVYLETAATYVLSSSIMPPVQVTSLLTAPTSRISDDKKVDLSLSQVETRIMPAVTALLTPPMSASSAPKLFVQPAQLNTSPALPNITRIRRHGSGSRRSLIAISVLLLLLVVVGGVAYAYLGVPSAGKTPFFAIVPSTTITITPTSKDLKQTYTLTGVIGLADANEQQVLARYLSVKTQTSSKTVNTTGQGMTAGTNATGSVTIDNATNATQVGYSAGTTFTGNSGVTVILDTATPAMLGPRTSYTEPAHASTIGTPGNIPARDIDTATNECGGKACVRVVNRAAFTGGTNSGTYAVVQQSDIDGATNNLMVANQPDPQRVLQGQIRSNEQLVGTPQCQSKASSDHQAGDVATQVTVSVTFTCTGEVYDKKAAQALSTTLLTHQAATDPGAGYALVGPIKTVVSNATLDYQGTVTITTTAEGIWVYQLSQEQQQNLARLVAGKNKQAAMSLLQQQPGVSQVDIQLAGGTGRTLSTNVEQIRVVVQSVTGT